MTWWIKRRDLVIKRSNYRLNRVISCRPRMDLVRQNKTNKKTNMRWGKKGACEVKVQLNQLEFKVIQVFFGSFDKRSNDFSEKNKHIFVFLQLFIHDSQNVCLFLVQLYFLLIEFSLMCNFCSFLFCAWHRVTLLPFCSTLFWCDDEKFNYKINELYCFSTTMSLQIKKGNGIFLMESCTPQWNPTVGIFHLKEYVKSADLTYSLCRQTKTEYRTDTLDFWP